eukprot:2603747-Amphidinium_carterae.1
MLNSVTKKTEPDSYHVQNVQPPNKVSSVTNEAPWPELQGPVGSPTGGADQPACTYSPPQQWQRCAPCANG